MLEKKYASSKTPENKILLNTRSNEYRLVLNANYKQYTEKCSDELRSLSKTNAKAFWKTVHKFSNRNKEDPSVEIETCYDYFKKLMQVMKMLMIMMKLILTKFVIILFMMKYLMVQLLS